MKQNYPTYLICLALALAIYFPLFGHLDTLPVRLWDESRLAINAYEMHKYGDWIVTHYNGKPDMWNTKPPLMIWMQVGFMKCIGVNELSIRLPSAIAAALTCFFIVFISVRYLKDIWFGVIATIVLITSQGYISEHGTRTGDYDSLVTLFITVSCFSIFLYTENQKSKYLYTFFTALILAVLTKGITIMLFMPALLVYLLIRKQLVTVLKNKNLYLGLIIFLITILGYYVLREHYNPGYIEAVKNNEMGGRYLKVIEGNSGNFWYYYRNIINSRLPEWAFLIPCGLIIGLSGKNTKLFRLTSFSILLLIFYFIIISSSKTKLTWYDIPMYPFLSIIISVFIYSIFTLIKNSEYLKSSLKFNILPVIFLFLICISPYQNILSKTLIGKDPDSNNEIFELEYFLKKAINGTYDINNKYFLYDGYNAQNWFYIRILQDKGFKTGYKDWTSLHTDEKVIADQNRMKEYIQNNYITQVLETDGNITIYKIIKSNPGEKKSN